MTGTPVHVEMDSGEVSCQETWMWYACVPDLSKNQCEHQVDSIGVQSEIQRFVDSGNRWVTRVFGEGLTVDFGAAQRKGYRQERCSDCCRQIHADQQGMWIRMCFCHLQFAPLPKCAPGGLTRTVVDVVVFHFRFVFGHFSLTVGQ